MAEINDNELEKASGGSRYGAAEAKQVSRDDPACGSYSPMAIAADMPDPPKYNTCGSCCFFGSRNLCTCTM